MVFWLGTGLILLGVVAILIYPLWGRTSISIPMGPEAVADQEHIDLEIEKQTLLNSLNDLDLDLGQGRLNPDDYERLKTIDENRLGPVLDRLDALDQAGSRPRSNSKDAPRLTPSVRWAVSTILAVVVIGPAIGVYSVVHGKIGLEAKQLAAQSAPVQQAMPNPVEMVARLEKRLAENPNDLQGQIMAGRSYMTLQRMEDARRTWTKVIEMDYGNYEAHHSLGLVLLQTNPSGDPKGIGEALKHFEIALFKVPREPAILWYQGVALVQLGRTREADESWTTAFQNLPQGSDNANMVKEALQDLRAGRAPTF